MTLIWYDGWQDAHARILPAELARLRTRESFKERLEARLADVRVVGPVGAPFGFCMLKGDELYQLYVSPEARGTGLPRSWPLRPRIGYLRTAQRQLGPPVQSEMIEQLGSTKNPAGGAPAPL